MPQLRELNLSLNKLGDPAMQSLGAAVKSGALSSLRVMRLSENRIGAGGARAFAKAITGGQRLPALTLLSFDGNQLGDAGVAALAGPLGDGPDLLSQEPVWTLLAREHPQCSSDRIIGQC